MQRWPWITLLLVVIIAITPPGWELIQSAFFSSEQLSRNIAQPLIYMGLTIAAVVALIEAGIRYLIYRAMILPSEGRSTNPRRFARYRKDHCFS